MELLTLRKSLVGRVPNRECAVTEGRFMDPEKAASALDASFSCTRTTPLSRIEVDHEWQQRLWESVLLA